MHAEAWALSLIPKHSCAPAKATATVAAGRLSRPLPNEDTRPHNSLCVPWGPGGATPCPFSLEVCRDFPAATLSFSSHQLSLRGRATLKLEILTFGVVQKLLCGKRRHPRAHRSPDSAHTEPGSGQRRPSPGRGPRGGREVAAPPPLCHRRPPLPRPIPRRSKEQPTPQKGEAPLEPHKDGPPSASDPEAHGAAPTGGGMGVCGPREGPAPPSRGHLQPRAPPPESRTAPRPDSRGCPAPQLTFSSS